MQVRAPKKLRHHPILTTLTLSEQLLRPLSRIEAGLVRSCVLELGQLTSAKWLKLHARCGGVQ